MPSLHRKLRSLPHHHRQGIACLSFSNDGRRLATVGVDSDKSVAVWRSCSGEWFDAELQVDIMIMSTSNRECTIDMIVYDMI